MDDDQRVAKRRVPPRVAGAVGLLAVGAVTGGILAASLTASAATTTATASSATAAPGTGGPGPGGPNSVRAGEKALTGTLAATAKANALKAVPGGTVIRVETDADGAVYEAHMTKADGTPVTVKFDKNLKVTAIQAGMGSHK
ncbi:MAG: hypothetical protein WCB04_11850 [Mycobacteriales bacterium]